MFVGSLSVRFFPVHGLIPALALAPERREKEHCECQGTQQQRLTHNRFLKFGCSQTVQWKDHSVMGLRGFGQIPALV